MSSENNPSGTPVVAPSRTLDTLFAQGLSSPQLGALITLASAMTLGIGLIVWSMKPDYVPVSQSVNREDALEIIDALRSSQTEYKIDPSTGLVLVPRDELSQIQLNLAAGGITENSPIGLELLNQEPSLGVSHFTETARYQHALEIELSRTISSMLNVDAARVHLALPKQSVFVRDRESASASVMVKAKQGRYIEDEQVNAVVNLVASSIPYLESGQVTVVDQWGRLLSTDSDSTVGARREHFQYARKLEQLYAERIETLLTPIVGKGRVRATVTAEFDYTKNEQTQELFEPDPAQLRSERLDDQKTTNGLAAGIPGALTNQPPAAAVVDQGNGAQDDPNAADGENGTPVNQTSSAMRNYELDKTITHTRNEFGELRRLSVAVVIDDQEAVGEDGEVVAQSLSDIDIEEFGQLAKEAIGFNEARGDSVVVFNRPFQPTEEITPVEPPPVWEQSWLWNMVKQVLIGLSVLLIVLLILRPAVKKLTAEQVVELEDQDEEGDGSTEESENRTALDSPPVVYGDILNMARAMAAEDPKRVAMLVKDWVGDR
ncbi:MAG: flagellar M-ring protein FliF [Gammaproteobacteria bacterium]|nr:flagellar M-ring protein FliF [Gammaproteobacteria bacterium]